jgi:hypothetical protein
VAAHLTIDSIFDTLLQVVIVVLTDLRNSDFIKLKSHGRFQDANCLCWSVML